MKIITRKATLDDLDILRRFEQGVINAEHAFDPTLKQDTHYYDLEVMLSSDDVTVIVAELNGVIIGSGYARVEVAKPYLKHKYHAYLGFMYVSPDQRGQGVNNEIIVALKKWASSKNISELRLDVYAGNIAAISAYEKAGFKIHMSEMRMSL